jgi:serine protease Do
VKDLMERFVCVRLVQCNGMDLSLFQFDYDLTFAVFFLNADKTIYGRYGSRSALKEATRDISLEGLRAAMEAALELHEQYPGNKASLAGKRGAKPRYARPELYPELLGKFTAELDYEGNVARSCIHCHQVRAAERRLLRDDRESLSEEMIRPWPMPGVVGLKLDPEKKATVEEVVAGSAAARDGFRAGDEIVALEGQPILSIADVQWVMHTAKVPAKLDARVIRDGRELELTLALDEGWRRGSEISWRPTTWDLRRMATGGMVLEELPAERRRHLRLDDGQLALHVKHVGQYGEHAVAKNAGFQVGDVVVEFDGRTDPMNETDLLAYVLENRKRGTRLPVTVLREGRRVDLTLRMQ